MALIKHRKFTADRYLDAFKEHEDVLWAYLQKWRNDLPNFPVKRTLETFKAYLKTPPQNCEAYEKMIQGIYEAHDLATSLGHDMLYEAMKQLKVSIDPKHKLHREVLALKVLTENPAVFKRATDMMAVSKGQRFSSFKGKKAKEITRLDEEMVGRFESRLRAMFAAHKGERKVKVRHFRDGDAVNFIVYHEERQRAELTFDSSNGSTEVNPLIFRPVRQDVLTYLPNVGKIEIETRAEKDKDAMRKTFGEVCLEDTEFFEKEGSEEVLDFSVLQKKDFSFDADDGHYVTLIELYFWVRQEHAPRFTVASRNVLETLENNELRHHLESSPIKSAKIKIAFSEKHRGKTVHLSRPNKIAFNRSTMQEEVFTYLKRWGLLVG